MSQGRVLVKGGELSPVDSGTTARAGRERGYRFGAWFATQAGYGLYRRLGFWECCHVDIYKSPA